MDYKRTKELLLKFGSTVCAGKNYERYAERLKKEGIKVTFEKKEKSNLDYRINKRVLEVYYIIKLA